MWLDIFVFLNQKIRNHQEASHEDEYKRGIFILEFLSRLKKINGLHQKMLHKIDII